MEYSNADASIRATVTNGTIENLGSVGRRRAADTEDEQAALESGLAEAGFDIADSFLISPNATAPGGQRGADYAAAELRVALEEDDRAVLLVQSADGLLSWQEPDSMEGASVNFRTSWAGEAVFRLRQPMLGNDGAQPGRRGIIGDLIVDRLVDPVRTWVLRFAVRRTVDAALNWIEGDAVTGPVVLKCAGAMAPAKLWLPGASPLVQDSPARRVLLLVHGTFSTTLGSFGHLSSDPGGWSLLEALAGQYDLVIGFDHRTLGQSPAENARDILAMLSGLRLAKGCELDAVAFSRGGLVLRTLLEELLPSAKLPLNPATAVFVGCTNGGTHLASPANWRVLTDTYTNLAAAGANMLGAAVGGPVAGRVLRETIKTLGRFVQLLSQMAIGEGRLPGLAAMEPGGATVNRLNGQSGLRQPPATYHAITASFEPGSGKARGLGKTAGLVLADRVTDRLFQQPNDLVVDTASMTEFGEGRDWLTADRTLAFGDTGEVFHTVYFAAPEVSGCLHNWLISANTGEAEWPDVDPQDRLRGTDLETRPEEVVYPDNWDFVSSPAQKDLNFGFGNDGFGPSIPTTPASLPRPVELPTEPAPTAPSAAEPPPSKPTVERFVAAEMQQYPQLNAPANLFVTVSPEALTSAGHMAAGSGASAIAMKADVLLELAATPLANCAVIGQDRKTVNPAKPGEQIVRFLVEGTAPGPARLVVEARQGTASLASITLEPEWVAATTPIIRASNPLDGAAPTGNLAVLRIYEYFQQGRLVSLRYDFVSSDPDESFFLSQPMPEAVDLKAYVAGVLKEAEAAWAACRDMGDLAYPRFMQTFSAAARTFAEALIPEDIRAFLTEHGHALDAIQILSENPIIPWELLNLPKADGVADGVFLAELGLVRWLHGVSQPPRELGLAKDRCFSVIPDYANKQHKLKGAEAEATMLQKTLESVTPLEADSLALGDWLWQHAADCDVLHFACHGKSDQTNAATAHLLMTGVVSGDKVLPDMLTADVVRQRVHFGAGPRRALIFLNACQAGQGGYGLTGAGGFAEAFLRPAKGKGAAAFVGAMWSIDDTLAQNFAEHFYAALKEGETLVSAQKKARGACQQARDLTWLAYSVYGNPFARVSG